MLSTLGLQITAAATMRKTTRLLPLSLLLLVLPVGLLANDNSGPKPPQRDPTADSLMVAAGFLEGHPDLRFRQRGLDEYGRENHPEAFQLFRKAAYYSDKPSQAIVGEMLWAGLGAAKDRGLAYVWMDLAAERGYRSFVEKRDLYWSLLDGRERARAQATAPSVRAEYADSAAEPRLARALRMERGKMTGSRLGSLSTPIQISVPGVGTFEGSRFYNPQYWDPEQYRAWNDSIWKELRFGQVNVGDVEQVGNAEAPGQSPTGP